MFSNFHGASLLPEKCEQYPDGTFSADIMDKQKRSNFKILFFFHIFDEINELSEKKKHKGKYLIFIILKQ